MHSGTCTPVGIDTAGYIDGHKDGAAVAGLHGGSHGVPCNGKGYPAHITREWYGIIVFFVFNFCPISRPS